METNSKTSQKLFDLGYLSGKQLEDLNNYESRNIFSLRTELRLLLYISILSLTTGIGILVYKNIETIGHAVIITFIGIACVACFVWCFRKAKPFSKEKVAQENLFFDYVLLAACLLAGIFTGYLQFEYNLFGDHYGLATLLPTLLYLFCAYYFDHRGVLSLAITGIGVWMGLSLTPADLLKEGFRYTDAYDFTGIILGTLLVLYTHWSAKEKLKVHFNFTCLNFAMHLLFLGALSGLFNQHFGLFFLIPIAVTAWYFFRQAHEMPSFNFLLFTTVYSYIAATYLIFRITQSFFHFDLMILLVPAYFILSCIVIIKWLVSFKKRINA